MPLTFHFTFTLPPCLSFPLSLLSFLSRGQGGRESWKRGMQGLSASADHQRPRAGADRKETKGQRRRESRCLQLRRRARRPRPCSLLGPQAEGGERARARARVLLQGGLHPILLTLSLSFFFWGTDYRKRSTWRFNWEFGSLWDGWKINFIGAS